MKKSLTYSLLTAWLLLVTGIRVVAQPILVTNVPAAYGQASFDYGPVVVGAFYGDTNTAPSPNAAITSAAGWIGVNSSAFGADSGTSGINNRDTNNPTANLERMSLAIKPGYALNNLSWNYSRADGPLPTDGVTISGFNSDPGAVFGGGVLISPAPTYSAGKLNFQITAFSASIRSITFTNLAATDGATLEITTADSTATGAQFAMVSMVFLDTTNTLLSSTFDGSSGTTVAPVNNTSGTNAVTVPWSKRSSVTAISSLTAISTGDSGTLGGFIQLSTAPVLADGHNVFINRNLNLDTNRFTTKRGYSLNFTVNTNVSLTALSVLAGHATGAAADQSFQSTLVYRLSGGTLGAPVSGSSFEDYSVSPVYHTVNFSLLGTTIGSGTYTLEIYQTGMTNVGGGGFSIYDGVALFSTNAALSIVSQPVPATRYESEGTNVFSVVAVGPGLLSYQWYKSPSTPVAGGTNATLTIPSLAVGNSGNYYVVVTSSLGASVTSDTVSLTVNAWSAPSFTLNPVSISAYANQSVSFSALAIGSPIGSIQYQWNKGGTPIPGATNTTLTLHNITAADVTSYTCVASNGILPNGTSSAASLTLLSLAAGSYAGAALDTRPLIYHRYSNVAGADTNVFNYGSLGVAGTGNLTPDSSYAIYNPGGAANEGPKPPTFPNFEAVNPCPYFDAFIVNGNIPPLGTISNRATMTAWVNLNGDQVNNTGIVLQRGSSGGCGLIIREDAALNENLGYMWNGQRWNLTNDTLVLPRGQWAFVAVVIEPTRATLYLHDGTNMLTKVDTVNHANANFSGTTRVGWDSDGGANGRRFGGQIDEVTIHNRALSSSEIYSLFAASSNYPPAIVASPQNATNYTGLPFSLSVTAQGTPPMSYQWHKQGSGAVSGATNDIYSVAAPVAGDTGDYFVIVTNLSGAATSALAHIEVLSQPPILTTVPQSLTNWIGLSATFSVAAIGSSPFTYQWSKVGPGALAGQTNASLTISNLLPGDSGTYFVTVVNPAGSTNSPSATLTVLDANQYTQMLFPTNGYTQLRTNFGGVIGTSFEMGAFNRTVTHLGYFDLDGDGLLESHNVGIYAAGLAPGSGTLLGSVLVPAGTAAEYTNGYRWVALGSPLTLTNGQNYVIAASTSAGTDFWPNNWPVSWNQAYVGFASATSQTLRYQGAASWPTDPINDVPGVFGTSYGAYNLMGVPTIIPEVTLLIEKVGSDVRLTWPQGSLQAAGDAAGTYTNVPSATSPYTVPATNGSMFFLVKVN